MASLLHFKGQDIFVGYTTFLSIKFLTFGLCQANFKENYTSFYFFFQIQTTLLIMARPLDLNGFIKKLPSLCKDLIENISQITLDFIFLRNQVLR